MYNNSYYNLGIDDCIANSLISDCFTDINKVKNYDFCVVYLAKDSNYGSISKLYITNCIGCTATAVYTEVNHPTGDYYRARSCYIIQITDKNIASFSADGIKAIVGIDLTNSF